MTDNKSCEIQYTLKSLKIPFFQLSYQINHVNINLNLCATIAATFNWSPDHLVGKIKTQTITAPSRAHTSTKPQQFL